jgi:hypothetical protein
MVMPTCCLEDRGHSASVPTDWEECLPGWLASQTGQPPALVRLPPVQWSLALTF